jgi:Ca2+-transporting ATPase
VQGLSSAEAGRRLTQLGPNELPRAAADPLWKRFLLQFRSPLVYLLLGALFLDLGLWYFEDQGSLPLEAVAIALILLLNATLGVVQEYRSEKALSWLEQLASPQSWVWRDDQFQRLPSRELVPGDWVRLEAGDRIPADGRVRQVQGVAVDESVLTGESFPIDKSVDQLLSSGTLLLRGSLLMEVTATGSASTMGRLSQMLDQIRAVATPLERRLNQLGGQIARWVILLTLLLGLLGLLTQGLDQWPRVVVFAVALAVAAVPEGLPAVLTLTLALGVERMARRKAVVRRLVAVEALGSVTVIASDKTGTLTRNQLEVHQLESPEQSRALLAMVLASDADPRAPLGDPLEQALYRYAASHGIEVEQLRTEAKPVGGRAFDSAWGYMQVVVQYQGKETSYFKGAPEALWPRCQMLPDQQQIWQTRMQAWAAQGYRVLALAWAPGSRDTQLEFLGLVALWDPPRPEAAPTIALARQAGIRVLMITGDHPATAQALARQVGLEAGQVVSGDLLEQLSPQELARTVREVSVYARVKPEQKLKLIEALQAQGEVVAMTGDGVNDAPALKRANIGVAMGQQGSQVTREVADLVLLDDNLATLVAAIEEGRSIYENIQKFLRFLFTTNISEVLVVAVGVVMAYFSNHRAADGSLILPLTAAQILWINLVTDGLPALLLALDRNPGVMQQPPRSPLAPLLDRPSLGFIAWVGSAKAGLALLLMVGLPWLGQSVEAARSLTFHFMALGQLVLTYASRHTALRPLNNPALHWAVGVAWLLQIGVGWWPPTMQLLETVILTPVGWLVAALAAVVAWAVAELVARRMWPRSSDS